MNDITIWLSENWIALTAMGISLVSAYISWEGYMKSIVKLEITADDENNFSFGYILYTEKRVLMVSSKILNLSTSDTTISSAKIKYMGKIYEAKVFPSNWTNTFDKSSFLIHFKNYSSKAVVYALNKDNLIGARIDYHGSKEGYFTFLDFPLLHKETILKMTVFTPTKSFACTFIAKPLPDKYKIKNQIIPK